MAYSCHIVSVVFCGVLEVGMSVYQEVLSYAQGWPDWQQDALRRIVQTGGQLTQQDIEEIAELCKKEQGWPGIEFEPTPIEASHLPNQSTAVQSVRLEKLHSNKNVCATLDDQELVFSQNGLSVFYGDNGSGKSSYARVIKQACRARGQKEKVEKNANTGNRAEPKATIEFSIDRQTKLAFDWQNNKPAPDELSQISVFDHNSAQVYIADKTDPAYKPAGMDLLTQLAEVCGQVQDVINTELDRSNRIKDAGLPFDPPQNTAVSKLFDSLDASTDPEEVKKLAGLSDEEKKQLAKLKEELERLKKANPQNDALAIDKLVNQCNPLYQRLVKIQAGLGENVISQLASKLAEYTTAQQASKAAQQQAFSDDDALLNGVGACPWKKLWDAARRYSTEAAYPDQDFPVTEGQARCVLCHQPLDGAATNRLQRFEEFVREDTQQQEADAQKAVLAACKTMTQLVVWESGDDNVFKEIDADAPDLAKTLREYMDTATAIQAAIGELERVVRGGEAPTMPDIGKLPDDALPKFKKWLDDKQAKAAELRNKDNSAEQEKVQQQINELEAKEMLGQKRQQVLRYLDALKRIELLTKAKAATNTSHITRATKAIAEQEITDSLCKAFESELKKLGVVGIQPKLESAGGQRGAIYHHIVLANTASTAPNPDAILSEGEHRVIALAAFLAELDVTTESGIVFDDPVCSLDHRYRRWVAGRLAEEARGRQVVVFTHDIIFLLALEESAKEMRADFAAIELVRQGDRVGRCEPGLPWPGMTTQRRIGWLRNKWQAAEKIHRTQTSKDYETAAKELYGFLREAWERGIEEVLLNRTVMRYKASVETQRLENALDISESDYKVIDDNMGKCSAFHRGHDDAAAMGGFNMPTPDQLKQDIDALENWVADIWERRKKKKKK